jgi:hypothetical protein
MSISGSWKIVSQNNGPSPVCVFGQAGNDFTGSCIGPNAKGAITGTITGDQPRWRWQWVTYAGNSSGSFDFMGTLTNNTITGVILRRGTDLSLNFTAERQSVSAAPEPRSVPTTTTNKAPSLDEAVAQIRRRAAQSPTSAYRPGDPDDPATVAKLWDTAGRLFGFNGVIPSGQSEKAEAWVAKQLDTLRAQQPRPADPDDPATIAKLWDTARRVFGFNGVIPSGQSEKAEAWVAKQLDTLRAQQPLIYPAR